MGHKPEDGEVERILEIDEVARETDTTYDDAEAARDLQEQEERDDRWERQRERNGRN